MNLISQIKEKLKDKPEIKYDENPGELTILPADESGFHITVYLEKNEIMVCFEGWHQHYAKTDTEEAFNCVGFGLSDHCRLIVHSKGKTDYKWTAQMKDPGNGKWKFAGTTCLLWYPFWKRKRVRYLQNQTIKVEAEPINSADAKDCAAD
jgi:hypothetical protein